ncbi:MAG TPA: protein kinase [Bryobacteraceae bacterium]|nr:protein kinase [Bryobacteraceae bacterium]
MSPADNIAHYRITGKLGEGGMGAVYRATDTKLNRDVAIKVLPEAFAADPDRLARLTREAQVLASLNHAGIASIYGVEDRALILELVEGPSLTDRIAQGPIPIDEALTIARQIAEALEYAHDHGIIHRDIKPANVKVTREGRVKVLDFGLATALAPDFAAADPATSPTLTLRATQAGMIMGTVGYMSPEQAKGKHVDRRTDIWAFGVVLAEMLTGRPLYTGETVSETLAAVIKDEPDLTGLPSRTPASVRRLLARCLEKDPRRRLQAIGEARIAIENAGPNEPESATLASTTIKRGLSAWWIAVALLPALILGGLLWQRSLHVRLPLQRFTLDLGPDAIAGNFSTASISPNGSRIVFPVRNTAAMTSGQTLLATQLLSQSKASVLSGTENAADAFFSPDGASIGFFADGKLKKVSVHGGAPIALCDVMNPRGGTWGADGNIIANLDVFHLFRVPVAGKPEILTSTEDSSYRTSRWPQILPGGGTVIFTAHTSPGVASYDDASIEALSLKSGKIKLLYRGGFYGRYVPSGHLLYARKGTLFAARFDLDRLELRGEPVPIVDDLAANVTQGGGQFDVAAGPTGSGILVYLAGKPSEGLPLTWLDASGKTETFIYVQAGVPLNARFSADGRRLAFSILGDVNVYDIERGAMSRITTHSSPTGMQVQYIAWMRDGRSLLYSEDGNFWYTRADGSTLPQKIFEAPGGLLGSISPDGRWVTFSQVVGGQRELWRFSLDTSDAEHPKAGKPEALVSGPGTRTDPILSPDGHWLAYTTTEAGRNDVFVQPFSNGSLSSSRVQISTEPGRFPVWSPGGKELLYVTGDGHIMSVAYTASGESFNPGKPRLWTPADVASLGPFWPLALAPDGKRLVAVLNPQASAGGEKGNLHLTFLLNFFDELKRRAP